MILLVQHRLDGTINSVSFVPPAYGDSIDLKGDLPVVRVVARDALKSWKGETLAGAALHQECGRAQEELLAKYRVQHGKLVPHA